MRHDLILQGGPYTLRPLSEADFSPLMALALAHAAEYAQMAVHPGTPAFYQGGLDAPTLKLLGTSISTAEGTQVSGNAGCNTFKTTGIFRAFVIIRV